MSEFRREGFVPSEGAIKPEVTKKFGESRERFGKDKDSKSRKIEIPKGDLPDTLEGQDLAKHKHRVAFADIMPIVDRFAMTQARAKVKEHLEQKARWYNRWFVRQTEQGYLLKYYAYAREEILKNKNLLSEIDTRWFKKSQGKKLAAGDEERQYELLDEVVESVFQEKLAWEKSVESKATPEKREVGKIAGLDAAAAGLIADYVLQQNGIASRKDFDGAVEHRILSNPDFAAALGIDPAKTEKMYASNLFYVAEQYKKHFEEKLKKASADFGPEQAKYIRDYLSRVIDLDVTHAKMQADLYETKSTGVMRIVEGAVNLTQSPYFKGQPKTWYGKALNKVAGLTLGNPILYAYLGNRAGYSAAVATGSLAAKAALGKAALGAGIAAVGIGPGMVMVVGAGIGAGIYLGARAVVERLRDIRRREEESALGLRKQEKIKIGSARDFAMYAVKLAEQKPEQQLTDEEKQNIVKIMATLRLQDTLGRNLLGAEEEEGKFYKTNFMAVQDLRKALEEFWRARAKEFGDTAESQTRNLERYLAAAESDIAAQLKDVDKETAREIRNRGIKVGLAGAAMTMAAGTLAPGVGKLLKKGANWTMEFFGGHAKFDTSKVTFTEEVWHKIAEKFGRKHYGTYQGNFNSILMAGQGRQVGSIVEFPKEGGFNLVRVNQNGHEYLSVWQNGQALPNVKIPLDAQGHISDPASLDVFRKMGWDVEAISKQLPVAGGGGGGVHHAGELYSQVKAEHLNGAGFEQVHTKTFYNNGTPDHSEFNELRLYVKADAHGNAVMSTDLLQKGSFRVDHGIVDQPDMVKLLAEHKLRYIFMTKEGAVNFTVGADQQLVIPKGSKMYDLIFDPTTGKIRSDVLFGTAQAGARADGSLDVTWINADHGTGAALPVGAEGPSTIDIGGYRLRPPMAHDFGEPSVFAGYRREKDKDIDKLRLKQTAGQVEARVDNQGVVATGEGTAEGSRAAGTVGNAAAGAAAEVVGGVAAVEIAATTGGGGGGTTTTEVKASKGRAAAKVGKVEAQAETIKSGAEAGGGVEKPKAKREKKEDKAKLEDLIEKFNEQDGNRHPHYELKFEEALLNKPEAIIGFVRSLIRAIKDSRNINHVRGDRYWDKNVILDFKDQEPQPPTTDSYGSLVLRLNPRTRVNALAAIMRRQIDSLVSGGSQRAAAGETVRPEAGGNPSTQGRAQKGGRR